MRSNRDGKAVVPGSGGYDIEVVEVTGPPNRMMAMPPAKSRGRLIPMGDGEDLPDRPSPVSAHSPFAGRKKRSKTPLIPVSSEIQSLPRWAKVAFVARCARRVAPAFGFFWKEAPEHHLQAVEKTISLAEQAARAARGDNTAYAAGIAARADDVGNAAARAGSAAYVAGNVAAGNAAYAAGGARVREVGNASTDVTTVSVAARVIFETATVDSPLTAQLRCIRRDFVRLKKLAKEQKWTDDTPVPPDVFGPMWPEGVEPYWAVEPPLPPPPAAAPAGG